MRPSWAARQAAAPEAQLKTAEASGDAKPANKLLRTQVGAGEEIAEVSRATGIPVSKMMQGEREAPPWRASCTSAWWARRSRAPGGRSPSAAPARACQREPVVCRILPVPRPTGGQETELCKTLAEFLDSEEHLIRIGH